MARDSLFFEILNSTWGIRGPLEFEDEEEENRSHSCGDPSFCYAVRKERCGVKSKEEKSHSSTIRRLGDFPKPETSTST